MTTATAIYRSIMLEIERRRLALNVPHWQVNDAAGTQDGYFAKMLLADTPSGRQASWETLQLVVDALFPDGFEVEIKVAKGTMSADDQRRRMRFAAANTNPRSQRELMSDIRKLGIAKLSPAQRIKIARKAGIISGRKRRQRARANRSNKGVSSNQKIDVNERVSSDSSRSP